jgi:hypothetical protein
MKLILFILSSWFKFNAFNDIYNFTLFNFLKDVSTLTSYTLLDASTLNPNLSFKTHESYSDKMKLKDVIEIVN